MDKDCQVPTSTSSPDLSAESTNEQMGTLKNLLLWLIFELSQLRKVVWRKMKLMETRSVKTEKWAIFKKKIYNHLTSSWNLHHFHNNRISDSCSYVMKRYQEKLYSWRLPISLRICETSKKSSLSPSSGLCWVLLMLPEDKWDWAWMR